MNKETAYKLNELTSAFYARCASSFSETREHPWSGWGACIEYIADAFPRKERLSVLDIGCGNLRFEEYLSKMMTYAFIFRGIDNCPALVGSRHDVSVQQLDIVDALLGGERLSGLIEAPASDVVCAFGLMHHIPGQDARKALLDAMLDKARPGSLVMVAFWQFERDERLARKALQATARALELYPWLELDEGDWFLGWQEEDDVFRYCHSFDNDEVDELARQVRGKGQLIARFWADGKSDDLNSYLVFERL